MIARAAAFDNAGIWKPIIEGQFFYKVTDYSHPHYARGTLIEQDPETIPISIDLAAPDRVTYVTYYYGRWSQYQLNFEGLQLICSYLQVSIGHRC